MSKPIRVGIYLAMGWLFMLALGPIISAVSESLLAWLFGGTLFYSVGSVFFVTNRPMLWQGFFDAHDLWHVFVLGGSVCHYVFVSRCLLTLAA